MRHVTYANVASTLALVIAVAASSPADAARSMITGRDIRNNTVASVDLANNGINSVDLRDGQVGLRDLAPSVRAKLAKADRAFTRVDYGGDPVVVNPSADKTSTCPAGTVAIGGAFTALGENYPTMSTYHGTTAWMFGAKSQPTGFGGMSGRAICLGR